MRNSFQEKLYAIWKSEITMGEFDIQVKQLIDDEYLKCFELGKGDLNMKTFQEKLEILRKSTDSDKEFDIGARKLLNREVAKFPPQQIWKAKRTQMDIDYKFKGMQQVS